METKRRCIRRSLTRTKLSMDSLIKEIEENTGNMETVFKLETLLNSFEKEMIEFNEILAGIMETLDESKPEDMAKESEILDEKEQMLGYFASFKAKALTLKIEISKNNELAERQANSTEKSSATVSSLKLPKMEIPTFDGDLTKFYSFKNRFQSLVHHNQSFDSVLKLHYLTNALVGNAQKVASNFDLNDLGYEAAWEHVLWTFDNKRAIIAAHFGKLANVESMKNEAVIRDVLSQVTATLRALKALNLKSEELFSMFLCYLIAGKLDKNTLRDWQNSLQENDRYPSFEELEKFLGRRSCAVEERQKNNSSLSAEKENRRIPEKKSFNVNRENGNNTNNRSENDRSKFQNKENNNLSSRPDCALCSQSHPIYICEAFKSKTPFERYEFAKNKGWCLICFKAGHPSKTCKSERGRCQCGESHSYLLHFEKTNNSVPNNPQPQTNKEQTVDNSKNNQSSSNPEKKTNMCVTGINFETVLLPSAVVKFKCGSVIGKAHILLDVCSQATFVADTFVKKFGLSVERCNSIIRGVGQGPSASTPSNACVEINLISNSESWQIPVRCDVVPASIISYEVQFQWPADVHNQIRLFKMADPSMNQINVNVKNIDIVVGAKYFETCICNETRRIGELTLRLSRFGWITSGVAPVPTVMLERYAGCTLQEIDENLKRFWKLEEPPEIEELNSEEEKCVAHFENNVRIADDGKFVVKLPFKVDKCEIANNFDNAKKSLIRIENRLDKEKKSAYSAFIREYIEMGHMSLANNSDGPKYFIPHREVIREESATTPLRVVFNASSKKIGKLSLNEGLMIGPTVQKDLFDILIAMRSHSVFFVADIAKMYRMVWVDESDRDMQRILWREDPSQPIQEYRLNTVTYGTAPAAFLATNCLRKIANEIKDEKPIASTTIAENFYMDDFQCGGSDVQEAVEIQKTVHEELLKRGFLLRKYASNSKEFLGHIPQELQSEAKESLSILGVYWIPSSDLIGVKLKNDFPEKIPSTKRIILSVVAGVFDLFGILAPVTVQGKLLLQKLWLAECSWDQEVPDDISRKFREFIENLIKLSSYRVLRCVVVFDEKQLVVFCDASEDAYCIVIYVRNVCKNQVDCRFVCSKTRVSPLKRLSIPKLELCAAALAAEFASRVAKNLKINEENIFAFSDSTCVLCWLSQPSGSWKTFVSNRVNKVLAVIPFARWNYVQSAHNPADFATRQLESVELSNQKSWDRWLMGPAFLKESNGLNYFQIPNLEVQAALDQRKLKKYSGLAVVDTNALKKFSDFGKLVRVIAYVLRICKYQKSVGYSREIDTLEFKNAWLTVVKVVQFEWFSVEIQALAEKLPLKKKSRLLTLAPFLDSSGVLRVGGRLENAENSFDVKHPIILPIESFVTKLFVRHLHIKYFHANRSFLSTFLSRQYWIVGGLNKIVKSIVWKCVTCARYRAQSCEQIMGQLPSCRVTISSPFNRVGVDLAGPFQCKCVNHRSKVLSKVYASIFVCLVTRCVHIEVVSDLSTDKFIEAFVRFTSVRGVPAEVRSDNGTNFVGCANLLKAKKNYRFEFEEEKIVQFATREGISWHFNPPKAPHFGGIWEAAVKSAKSRMMKVTNGAVLSFEEYSTLFHRISAVLNSRPLCYSETPNQECVAITPAHFLIGRPMVSVPELDDGDGIPLCRRFQLVQTRLLGFWKAWRVDYLAQLQKMTKWKMNKENLKVGQIVLVKGENSKPCEWPLGLVEKVVTGSDGNVRVAEVRFNGAVKARPITSLILLPDPVDQRGEDVRVDECASNSL